MAQVFEKLVALENAPITKATAVVDDDTGQRIRELENHLRDITQQRIGYVEKLQQQQMEYQVKIMASELVLAVSSVDNNLFKR